MTTIEKGFYTYKDAVYFTSGTIGLEVLAKSSEGDWEAVVAYSPTDTWTNPDHGVRHQPRQSPVYVRTVKDFAEKFVPLPTEEAPVLSPELELEATDGEL